MINKLIIENRKEKIVLPVSDNIEKSKMKK